MVEIYVDGSYIDGRTGYGFVVLENNRLLYEGCGPVQPQDAGNSRQVAGELFAIGKAIHWCKNNDVPQVAVYYDYLGVEKWATGAWKTNQPLTQRYATFMQSCGIKVYWKKVKSHSNNTWNDRADELARQGAAQAQAVESQAESPLLLALKQKAIDFITYLHQNEIAAELDQIYNNMYARILIPSSPEKNAYFDLYNTKAKPFHPYLHAFKSSNQKQKVLQLWQAFHQTN